LNVDVGQLLSVWNVKLLLVFEIMAGTQFCDCELGVIVRLYEVLAKLLDIVTECEFGAFVEIAGAIPHCILGPHDATPVSLIAVMEDPTLHVLDTRFCTVPKSAATLPVVTIGLGVRIIPDPAVSELMPPPAPAGHALRQSVPRQSDGVVIFAPFVPRGPPFTVTLPESR